MTGDSVKYDYEKIETMVQLLNEGRHVLEDTFIYVNGAAYEMANGVFLGQAGWQLSLSLGDDLCRSIHNLQELYGDMVEGLEHAVEDMRMAEERAANKFP